MTMKLFRIIKDSLKYPLSNTKLFIIFGVLFLFNHMLGFVAYLKWEYLTLVSAIFGVIISILCAGYLFRVIETTLEDNMPLPSFNNWKNLLNNGAKTFIITLSYLAPALLTGTYLTLNTPKELLPLTFGNLSHLTIISLLLRDLLWPGLFNIIMILYNVSTMNPMGIWGLLAILYIILITPILLVAIVNMINAYGELKEAFNFHDITIQILEIGILKISTWYILTTIFYLVLMILGSIPAYFIQITPISDIIFLLWPLILLPYFYLYLTRSIAKLI